MDMDTRPLIQLENDLDRFGKHAMPYAARDTLNTAAFKTSDLAKRNISRKFIERNTWTRRSAGYTKTFARDIDRMESEAGSTQSYMRQQEEGFTQRKSGTHGVAVPTAAAAGQGRARVRTRRLQKKNWLAQVSPVSNRKRGTVYAVRKAVQTGRRVVHIASSSDHYGRPSGFYRVVGGSKRGRGWPKGAKLQLIYGTEKASIRVEPNKWLDPSARFVMRDLDKIYRDAINRQIRINRSFRDRG